MMNSAICRATNTCVSGVYCLLLPAFSSCRCVKDLKLSGRALGREVWPPRREREGAPVWSARHCWSWLRNPAKRTNSLLVALAHGTFHASALQKWSKRKRFNLGIPGWQRLWRDRASRGSSWILLRQVANTYKGVSVDELGPIGVEFEQLPLQAAAGLRVGRLHQEVCHLVQVSLPGRPLGHALGRRLSVESRWWRKVEKRSCPFQKRGHRAPDATGGGATGRPRPPPVTP